MKIELARRWSQPRRRVWLIVTALALSACGPAIKPSLPAPPQSGNYLDRSSPSTHLRTDGQPQQLDSTLPLAGDWWRSFGSPAIDSMVEQALHHHPSVEAAQATLQQARQLLGAEHAAFLPNLALNLASARQKDAIETASPFLSSGQAYYALHSAQLDIAYNPGLFGLRGQSLRASRAQVAISQAQWQATCLSLASNVVLAAISEASLQSQIATTEQAIAVQQQLLELQQAQHRLGAAAGFDVVTQQAALDQARQSLPPLWKQYHQSRDLLAMLTGQPQGDPGVPILQLEQLTLPASLPVSLPSQLLARRPDLLAAAAQVEAAAAAVGIAVANRLPQISLSAAYGGESTRLSDLFVPGNLFWNVVGSASQSVFDFGALKHQEAAAKAGLQGALANYRGAAIGAFQNVADSLWAIDADAHSQALAQASLDDAQRLLQMSQAQAAAGDIGLPVVLNAHSAQLQAKLTQIQALASRYSDTVALFQALGGGWWWSTSNDAIQPAASSSTRSPTPSQPTALN